MTGYAAGTMPGLTETFHYMRGPSRRCQIGEYELHCGDCFQILNGDKWADVRIELSGDWYLIGVAPSAASQWDTADARRYQ